MAEPSYYVQQITSAMKRELSVGVMSTTGSCNRCKTEAARGCGVCLTCRTKELAALTGNDLLARHYRAALEAARELECRLIQQAEINDRGQIDAAS